jgi:hypothetical protein
VSIPTNLMYPYNGSISVIIDNGQTPVLFLNDTLYDNGTHRWIYFTYRPSTHEILMVPEFPIFLVLTLFMITAAIATATCRKRRSRCLLMNAC